MSNTPFAESLSDDPVERAIARKVVRILNDTTLSRLGRESLVRKAQRELIEHRRRKLQQQTLRQQLTAVKLPKGYQAHSIAISDGRVQVGSLNRKEGFVWLEAGKAPAGLAANQAPSQLPSPPKGKRKARKSAAQAVAERRESLGYGPDADCA